MKFRIYDTTNVKSGVRSSKPMIRIARKSGTVNFNKGAAVHFSLVEGMTVRFLQSEQEPGDWFIQFNHKDGFSIRQSSDKLSYVFNSTALVAEVMKSVECFDKGLNFGIGETVTYGKIEATALITIKK